jgi:hypothetical protein
MQEYIQGTFHFHSTYSHDGRSTLQQIASALSERGLSFCVMTEHFEDFDADKFDAYLREACAVTQRSGFLLVPGIEVNVSGLDIIIFPAREYAEIARFAAEGQDSQHRMFKVLAHPTKYRYEMVAKHLLRYEIDAIELWNQQEDGSHFPPMEFIEFVKTQPWRNRRRYFFGSDIHNVNLTVSNVISIPKPVELSAEVVIRALTEGEFVARNLPTGVEYCNWPQTADFDSWLRTLNTSSLYRGRLLRSVRSCLRSCYKLLPRDAQHSLNDFKNFVRNKV